MLPSAGTARNLSGRSVARNQANSAADTESAFHFKHRYAVEKKDRNRLLTRIMQVLDEDAGLGPLPYVYYVRASDQEVIFETDYRDSADSIACLITVDPSADRDRYVIFSISTAVKPHLRTDGAIGLEREERSESLTASEIATAIFEGLGRNTSSVQPSPIK